MNTFDSTLEDIMRLDYGSRQMLLEILQKRQIEERRNEIATNAKKVLKDFHSGKTQPLTANDVIERLNSL